MQRIVDRRPEIVFQGVDWIVDYFLSSVIESFFSERLEFFNFFFSCNLGDFFKHQVDLIYMLLNILTPSRVFNYQIRAILLECPHLFLLHILSVPMEMIIHHISLRNCFFHFGFKFVQCLISLKFHLSIKALEKFLKHTFCNLFENFIINLSFVLHSLIFVLGNTSFEDCHALLWEIGDGSAPALGVQGGNLGLNESYCFLFDLIAPILSHHFTLVWQVELLLVLDHVPSSVDEIRKTIDWNCFGTIACIGRNLRVEAFLMSDSKSLFQNFAFVSKLLLAVDFMR